jgi:hypothetical protein
MLKVSYVYPNVCEIKQRGSLLERWQLAIKLNCEYVEVPSDLIKNGTEATKTNLQVGDFLTNEAIEILYDRDLKNPGNLSYILHTEPSFRRFDSYGLSYQPPLKWYDAEWVNKLTNMIISLSKFFNFSPSIIEIHPGDKRNTFDDILSSSLSIIKKYWEVFQVEPCILLENRTGQFISTGKDISELWGFLCENYPNLRNKFGVVLDIQQLFTVTKERFNTELESIPDEILGGFHIHHRHNVPHINNEIPWVDVFNKISKLKKPIIINPEIHHKNKVNDAINFCKNML